MIEPTKLKSPSAFFCSQGAVDNHGRRGLATGTSLTLKAERLKMSALAAARVFLLPTTIAFLAP